MLLRTFLRDEAGSTSIEYALIATLVGVTIIVGLSIMGEALNNLFAGDSGSVASALDAAGN